MDVIACPAVPVAFKNLTKHGVERVAHKDLLLGKLHTIRIFPFHIFKSFFIIRQTGCILQIFIHRIKIPERSVNCIIHWLLVCMVRENIREHPPADIFRERQKHLPRLSKTPGCKCQPGKSNHCITPPVRKPRIARKHGHHPRGLAAHKKMVGGEDEPAGKGIIAFCLQKQPLPARLSRSKNLPRTRKGIKRPWIFRLLPRKQPAYHANLLLFSRCQTDMQLIRCKMMIHTGEPVAYIHTVKFILLHGIVWRCHRSPALPPVIKTSLGSGKTNSVFLRCPRR